MKICFNNFILVSEKPFKHIPHPLKMTKNNFYGNEIAIWELKKILTTLEELILGL